MLPHLVYKLDALPDMAALDDEQSKDDNTRSALGSGNNIVNVLPIQKSIEYAELHRIK